MIVQLGQHWPATAMQLCKLFISGFENDTLAAIMLGIRTVDGLCALPISFAKTQPFFIFLLKHRQPESGCVTGTHRVAPT
jgi:hypothetical protein